MTVLVFSWMIILSGTLFSDTVAVARFASETVTFSESTPVELVDSQFEESITAPETTIDEVESTKTPSDMTGQTQGEDDPFEFPMFMDTDPNFTWSEFDRTIENPIFSQGETLKYAVSWMGINAGFITMKLEVNAEVNNQKAYKMVVTGETNKTFSVFFKVKDVITSFMDPETFNSIHYIKNVREGRYRKKVETIYNRQLQKAMVKDIEYDLPPNSKDPIACIYALRRYKPSENVIIRMNSNSEGKHNFPVEIELSSLSTVTLSDGVAREVITGKPLPTWEGRVFEKRRSSVILWLTHDEYAVPLKLETKVRIGTLKAELVKRSGPGWEFDKEK